MIIKKTIVSEVSDGCFMVEFAYDGHAVSSGLLSKKLDIEQVKQEMSIAAQAMYDKRAEENFSKICEALSAEMEIPDIKKSACVSQLNEEPIERIK